jgi:predicted nucleotidyltransferase
MNNKKVEVPKGKISDFCRRWEVVEFALFGSVLREDFHPDSDIDVLVTFSPHAQHSLLDLALMEEELAKIFRRKVDLVEKAGVRNPFRRHEIFKNLEIFYAA